MKLNQLSPELEEGYRQLLSEAVHDLPKAKDAFEYEYLRSVITEMSSLLGRPEPNFSLVGKNISEVGFTQI